MLETLEEEGGKYCPVQHLLGRHLLVVGDQTEQRVEAVDVLLAIHDHTVLGCVSPLLSCAAAVSTGDRVCPALDDFVVTVLN